MFTMSIPLTLWRKNQEGRARAEASLYQADRERSQTIRKLESELRIARSSVMAALTILELYTSELIPQLSKNFKLLQRAYELGEVDIQRVSQTRERLLGAMTQYTKARVLYFDRAVTLEGLVGTEQWSKPSEPTQ
jgi:cobalt-zinc-cadmium efflux system outer membrane protein